MTSPDQFNRHTDPAVTAAYAKAQTAATIAAVISLDIDATADGGTILAQAEHAATIAHQQYQAALHQATAQPEPDTGPGTSEQWTTSPEETRLEDAYHDAYADYGELYFGDAEPEAINQAWTAVEAARQDLARARTPHPEPPAPDAGLAEADADTENLYYAQNGAAWEDFHPEAILDNRYQPTPEEELPPGEPEADL